MGATLPTALVVVACVAAAINSACSKTAGSATGAGGDSSPAGGTGGAAGQSSTSATAGGGSSTQTDSHNCGAVGHDCLGGVCEGGLCQPVVLATDDWAVDDIAVSGGYVYWSEFIEGNTESGEKPGHVYRVPVAGGSREVVQTVRFCSILAVDGMTVYYDAALTLQSSPSSGGASSVLWTVPAGDVLEDFVVRGDTIFLLDRPDGVNDVVEMLPTTGGGDATPLAAPTHGNDDRLFANSSMLFWTDDTHLLSLPFAGGTPQQLATAAAPHMFALDDDNAYFYVHGQDGWSAHRVSTSGGPVTNIGSLSVSIEDGTVGADDRYLYYAGYDGNAEPRHTLHRMPKAGGGLDEVIYKHRVGPRRIVADDSFIYFIGPAKGHLASILRLAK